jgi:translation initiation factor IF-3
MIRVAVRSLQVLHRTTGMGLGQAVGGIGSSWVPLGRCGFSSESVIEEADVFGSSVPPRPPPRSTKSAPPGQRPSTAPQKPSLRPPAGAATSGSAAPAFERKERKVSADTIIKNERIRYPQVRVIFDKVENDGDPKWQIMTKDDALAHAKKKKLDLILINENASPPVCKFMSALQFEIAKKKADAEQRSKIKPTKEIVIGGSIDPHDLGHKIRKTKELLDEGHPVKMIVSLTPREFRMKPTAIDQTVLKVLPMIEKLTTSIRSSKVSDSRREFYLSPIKSDS